MAAIKFTRMRGAVKMQERNVCNAELLQSGFDLNYYEKVTQIG